MLVNEYQVGLIIYMTIVCVKIFVLLYTVKIGIFVRLVLYCDNSSCELWLGLYSSLFMNVADRLMSTH